MIIVSVDPGETTGYMVAEVLVKPQKSHKSITTLWAGHWTGLESYTVDHLQGHLAGANVLVVEDYRIYPHKSRQHIGQRPYAIEVIGHLRLLAYQHDIPIHFQSASQAKQQWPNTRLARHYPLTSLKKLAGNHLKDALRHLLTYVENQTDYGHIFVKGGAI